MSSQPQALASLLNLEYRACYGIPAAGAHLLVGTSGDGGPHAAAVRATRGAYDLHRLRRDRLIAALRALHVDVPPPAPAYPVPALAGPDAALRLLAQIGAEGTQGYRGALASLTSATLRGLAVSAVAECARYRTQMLLAAGLSPAAASSALPGQSG